ncbi:MAG: trigger factor, partial [Gammaproteobacteria bacterium]|nr:trigger factor [Gammaproteobacteria bacterium]
ELDAEFFARFGVEDGELATFRQNVRSQMERERDREVADRFRSETLKRLGEANPIDVPQSLVARDADLMAQQMRQNMMMQGMPPEQAETIVPEAFTEDATRRVRLGLVLSEIVKREQIAVEAEVVRAEVERQAANYQDAESVIKWYYEDPERLQEIEMRCLEQKVVDWVAGQAAVKEVELAFDALMNPGQTGPDAKEEA